MQWKPTSIVHGREIFCNCLPTFIKWDFVRWWNEGYCNLMSATPPPPYRFSTIFLKLHRCFVHGLRMCIWFGPLSSNYFFTFFNLWTFNLFQSRIQCVVIWERNSSSILFRSLGNFADANLIVRHDRNALNLNLISKPRSLASNSVSSGSTLFAKQRG